MKILIILLFVSLAECSSQKIVLPALDPTKIESCDSGRGIYKLRSDCASSILELAENSVDQDEVVCCPLEADKNSIGQAARDYCEKNSQNSQYYNTYFYSPTVSLFTLDSSNKSQMICGGSVISEKFILTAASCFDDRKESTFLVRMGRRHENTDRIVQRDNVTIHPNYDSNRKYDDIALLEFSEPIEFSNDLQPACLEVDKKIESEDRKFSIFGYGETENEEVSVRQVMALVNEYSSAECKKFYGAIKSFDTSMPEGLRESQICAASSPLEDGRGSSPGKGDEGGPLVHKNFKNKKSHLTGIISFGASKGTTDPWVYTRVSSYIDWIESLVWPK